MMYFFFTASENLKKYRRIENEKIVNPATRNSEKNANKNIYTARKWSEKVAVYISVDE